MSDRALFDLYGDFFTRKLKREREKKKASATFTHIFAHMDVMRYSSSPLLCLTCTPWCSYTTGVVSVCVCLCVRLCVFMHVLEVLCTVSFGATCPDSRGMGLTALLSETHEVKRKKRPHFYTVTNLT